MYVTHTPTSFCVIRCHLFLINPTSSLVFNYYDLLRILNLLFLALATIISIEC